MLGWLGAKPKHLRRYVEFYNAKGIHAVTFVASVMNVLSFDLGKNIEERVRKLSDELASWLSDRSGGNRCLIFRTFSNAGWLAYGAILDNLKDREDLLEKIKGCVVDSGGDPDIDPKHIAVAVLRRKLETLSLTSAKSTLPSDQPAPPCASPIAFYRSEVLTHLKAVLRGLGCWILHSFAKEEQLHNFPHPSNKKSWRGSITNRRKESIFH